jgi:glycosyltransferase involved in cell wall biosynthesis
MSVGLVIPAYNAGQTLAGVLARVPAGLPLAPLVIVNDGSTDDTAMVARGLAATDHRVQVIDLTHNRGYGGAVKRGLAALLEQGVEVAVCLHADGQYAPEELPGLLAEREARGLDILQGSRLAAGTALAGGMPLYKYLGGRALTALENRVFGLALTDYHSGYMLFSRRALGRIPFARLSDSFDFDLEMIAAARALGLAVGERPIPTHYGDERSHLNPLTYGLRVLRVLLRFLSRRYHRLTA